MSLLEFNSTTKASNRIKVIGVGGGGGNAVSNMFAEGITDVDFIIVNTDAQVLQDSSIPIKIQIGDSGLGAGNKPNVGKESAEHSKEKIEELLKDSTDMVFVTAGMGGGTGTGAAPVIASVARSLEILTVAIVTKPFSWEGPRRLKQAEEGIAELKKYVDAIIIILNDKIKELHYDVSCMEGFKIADNILTTAAKGIAELITNRGYINVDFEDVKHVMEGGGKTLMSLAEASGEKRAVECVERALASPLLAESSIFGARKILLNISSSSAFGLKHTELEDITDLIKEAAGGDPDFVNGIYTDDALGEMLKLMIVVTNFEEVEEVFPEKRHVKKIVLYDDAEEMSVDANNAEALDNQHSGGTEKTTDEYTEGEREFFVNGDSDLSDEPIAFETRRIERTPDQMAGTHRSGSVDAPKEVGLQQGGFSFKSKRVDGAGAITIDDLQKKAQDRINNMNLSLLDVKGLSPEELNEFQRQPAFMRKNIAIDTEVKSHQPNVSQDTVEIDPVDSEVRFKENNRFLDNRVD